MRKMFLALSFVLIGIPLFAQDDCDPSSSMDDVWMGKRSEFGPNCMQYAINISMSTNHNRGLSLSDGTYIAVYSAERTDSPIPGGVWRVTFQDSQGWGLTQDERNVVFKRPGSIMNLGPIISMEFYTLDQDTGIIKQDMKQILKAVRDDMDDYEDELKVDVEPYYEAGKLYCKVTGNIMIGDGLKPTRAGDIIAYFFMSICYSINSSIKWNEMETIKTAPGMKLDFWNKSFLASALQIRGMDSKGNEVKEGRFVWSQSDGNKVIQLDNYGTECFVYIQVKNSSKEKNAKVVEELNKWVTAKKPKNAESAEVKLYGDTPWVLLKFKIGGKKGSDLFEEIREDVINDWGDDFIEEAEDVTD